MLILVDFEALMSGADMGPVEETLQQVVMSRHRKALTMNNLKVATRLMMLIGALSLLLMAIGGLGLFGIGQSNEELKSVFEDRTVPAAHLGRINALVMRSRMAVCIALLTPAPEVIKERSSQVESNMAAIGKEWDAHNVAATRYATIRAVSIAAIASGLLFAGLFGFVLVRSLGRQLGDEPGEAADQARHGHHGRNQCRQRSSRPLPSS